MKPPIRKWQPYARSHPHRSDPSRSDLTTAPQAATPRCHNNKSTKQIPPNPSQPNLRRRQRLRCFRQPVTCAVCKCLVCSDLFFLTGLGEKGVEARGTLLIHGWGACRAGAAHDEENLRFEIWELGVGSWEFGYRRCPWPVRLVCSVLMCGVVWYGLLPRGLRD